jgi:PKD repeat protein
MVGGNADYINPWGGDSYIRSLQGYGQTINNVYNAQNNNTSPTTTNSITGYYTASGNLGDSYVPNGSVVTGMIAYTNQSSAGVKWNYKPISQFLNTYSWSTTATTPSITVASAGLVSVIATDYNGCSNSASTTVIVNAKPSAAISGSTSFCTGGNTVLTSNATAGSGAISSYQWQVGGVNVASAGTSATYTATAAGSYTVTVTNSNGCVFTSSAYVVSVNALPTAPISGNTSFCTGGNTVLTSNATAGSGTISSYQWKVGGVNVASGGTSATYTATAAGSYTVTVTNSNGCVFTSSAYVVSVNALPTAPISGNTSFCTGGNTVLTSNATAGSGTISTYQWQAGGVNVASGGTSATYTATAAGSYTVMVTNSNGCSFTSSAYVVSVNALPTAPISGNTSFCTGGSTVLTSNATAGSGTISSYQWQIGGVNVASGGTSATYTATAAGNYTVTVTNSNGCSFTSSAYVVSVNALPTAPTITAASATSFCSGGSVILSAVIPPLDDVSGARLAVGLRKLKAGYTGSALRLRRSTDNMESDFGFVGFDLDVNAISTWLNGASGFCTVLYDQSGNGGHVTQTVAASQPLLVLTGINNKPVLRFTTAQTMFNAVNYTPPYSVVYGSRVIGTSARVLAAKNNNWLLGYLSGKMDMAYFDGFVSTSAYDPPSSTNPYTVLNQYNVYAASGTGAISTFYKNGVQLFSNSGGLSGPNGIQLNGTSLYTTDYSNCEFTDVLIYGSALAAADIGKLNTSIVDYYSSTYLWSTGATTPTITATTSGNYTLRVTNSNGCQSASSAATVVTVNALPTAPISGNTSFCTGGNNVLSSNATAGSGTISSYQWQVGGVNVASAGTSATYTATAAGSYTVTVTNSNGCSFTSLAYVVSVNALPTAPISGNTSFCTGGSTVLASNATAGSGTISSYQWKVGGVNVASAGTSATYTATAAGSYTVTVTNSNGCSFTSSAYVVSVNALPTAPISGNTSFCTGANTVLSSNATAGSGTISSYQWKVGGVNVASAGTSATYTATAAGSYTVTVTNSNGCVFTSSAYVVSVNALPTAPVITASVNSVCAGSPVTLTAAASGNTWTQQTNFGGEARQGAFGFSIGDKGYLGTGVTEGGSLRQDFWEFNPVANTWAQKANFPQVRQSAIGFSTIIIPPVSLRNGVSLRNFITSVIS